MLLKETNRKTVKYGATTIEYALHEKEGLKGHYISVDNKAGVVLKGNHVSPDTANKLILKKAKWILNKLKLVGSVNEEDIVTGSRIPYLGKTYYVQLIFNKETKGVAIEFNQSKFKITIGDKNTTQSEIRLAIDQFYRQKSIEKITSRLERWSAKTNLKYQQLRFIKMGKRWGSCTTTNNIIINIEAIKLPYQLIDYVIVHELCHTKVKDHSRKFWAELSKHLLDWRELDERMKEIKM